MKKLRLLFVLLWMTSNLFSSPVTGLLERIDKGASSKFIIDRKLIFLNSIRKVIK
jgi:alpha-N-acetylglucosaminidase